MYNEALVRLSDSKEMISKLKVLVIDNYDSFTYNLANLIFLAGGAVPEVIKNNEITFNLNDCNDYSHIIISPGPGTPTCESDFGFCGDIINFTKTPILGVCLGHQGIAHQFGGVVCHAPKPVHGLIDTIVHNGKDIYSKLPQDYRVVRYHSLVVATPLPSNLEVMAWTRDGLIMGLRHKHKPIYGVQFHPESICSEYGLQLMENFLRV